jgi:hypothetical protein
VNLSPALFGLSLADFITKSAAQRIIDYVRKVSNRALYRSLFPEMRQKKHSS